MIFHKRVSAEMFVIPGGESNPVASVSMQHRMRVGVANPLGIEVKVPIQASIRFSFINAARH